MLNAFQVLYKNNQDLERTKTCILVGFTGFTRVKEKLAGFKMAH